MKEQVWGFQSPKLMLKFWVEKSGSNLNFPKEVSSISPFRLQKSRQKKIRHRLNNPAPTVNK
jgi:hypothetical protein